MSLQYLVFDYSEDGQGHGSFDAMASAAAAQRPALEAEVLAVLRWAEGAFPGGRAPLDEGGEWDFALSGVIESAQDLSIDYLPDAETLQIHAQPPAPPRITLDLTVTGTPAFCAAFRRAFGIEPEQGP